MAVLDKGINKAVDRFLKDFSDELPKIFAYVMGAAPPGAEVVITPLRSETSPPAVYPDYVARVVVDSERPFVFHVEFQLLYKGEVPEKVTRRGASLMLQHNLPVITVLLLLSEWRAPAEVPDRGEIHIPPTKITHEYRVERMWKKDPTVLIKAGDVRFLPWALLMDVSDEQARQLAARVERDGDEETRARMAALGVARYGKKKMDSIMGGSGMGLMAALLESDFFVELREETLAKGLEQGREMGLEQGREQGLEQGREQGLVKGRQEGLREGLERGRAEAARKMFRLMIRNRYPAIAAMPEIDRIASEAEIEEILQSYDTATESSLRQAVLNAAAK